jgi:hypothetical protein
MDDGRWTVRGYREQGNSTQNQPLVCIKPSYPRKSSTPGTLRVHAVQRILEARPRALTYGRSQGEEMAARERDAHCDGPVRERSQLQVDREHPLSGETETPMDHRRRGAVCCSSAAPRVRCKVRSNVLMVRIVPICTLCRQLIAGLAHRRDA